MKRISSIAISLVLMIALLQISLVTDSFASLVAYWNFNEGSGTKLNDVSCNGHDGTIHGAAWVIGKYGTALFFDGKNDYVTIPDSNSFNSSDEITVEFWVNIPSDIAHWGGIIEKQRIILKELSILVNL